MTSTSSVFIPMLFCCRSKAVKGKVGSQGPVEHPVLTNPTLIHPTPTHSAPSHRTQTVKKSPLAAIIPKATPLIGAASWVCQSCSMEVSHARACAVFAVILLLAQSAGHELNFEQMESNVGVMHMLPVEVHFRSIHLSMSACVHTLGHVHHYPWCYTNKSVRICQRCSM